MDPVGEAEGASRKPPRRPVWALGSWWCHAPCLGAQDHGQFNRKMFLVGILDSPSQLWHFFSSHLTSRATVENSYPELTAHSRQAQRRSGVGSESQGD